MAKKFAGKETYAEELAEGKAVKSGRVSPQSYAKQEVKESKMACGGKVKGMSAGGIMRGTGAATKGKRFSGTF